MDPFTRLVRLITGRGAGSAPPRFRHRARISVRPGGENVREGRDAAPHNSACLHARPRRFAGARAARRAGSRRAGGARAAGKPVKRGVASFWTSAEPTFDEGTYHRINAAMLSYSAIEVRGGWPMVAKLNLGPARPARMSKLRQRLAITDDLPAEVADGDAYDMMLTEAVKRFQARHGLPETGRVGPQTIEALNVPVKKRIRQLAASLDRLNGMGFTFGQRYVVVNIPAAVAEAVEDGKVARRYVTVVGKVDRPSPTLTTQITAVNLNPTWTVPLSILKKDIAAKMRKDPGYVARMKMRVLDGAGNELDPRSVDWSSDRTPNFTVRQDSGEGNALGNVRIDMPNPHSVYMHDTNHREGLLGGLSLPVLGLHAGARCARSSRPGSWRISRAGAARTSTPRSRRASAPP